MEFITENWQELFGLLILFAGGYLKLYFKSRAIDQRAQEQKLEAQKRHEEQKQEFNALFVEFGKESLRRNERLENALQDQQKLYGRQIDDLKQTVTEQSETIETNRSRHVEEIRRLETSHQEQTNELRREIQDYQALAVTEQRKREELQITVTDLSVKVTGQDELIKALQRDLTALKGQRDDLQRQLDEALTTIRQKDSELEALRVVMQNQITHLENLLTTKDRQIKELQDKVARLELEQQREEPTRSHLLNPVNRPQWPR